MSKRETTISKSTSGLPDSTPPQSKAELARAIQDRVYALGMDQTPFTISTNLNLFDLPDLINGEDSDITVEHLREALETLYIADSVREIINLKLGIVSPVTPEKINDLPKLSIGEMIRRRRVELDLAQVEVARRVGVSGVLVSQWEMGKSRIMADDIPKIAAALSTTSSRLMGELPTDTQDAYVTLKRTLADLSARMSLDQLGDLCAAAAKILGRS